MFIRQIKLAVQRLLLGDSRSVLSSIEFKSALLRGIFSLLSCIVGIVYIFIDGTNGIYQTLPWYSALVLLSILSLVLNRRGKELAANIIFVVTINGITYILASSDDPSGGIYLYFLTTAIIALVVFSRSYRWMSYFFVITSFVLGLLAYLGRIEFVTNPPVTPEYIKMNFITNFCVSFLIIVLIIFFLTELHHDIESSLRKSEEEHSKVSEELKRSQQRFKMAVEGTKAGIYEWDKATGQIYIGSHYKKMLGYLDADLNTLSVEEYYALVHPDDLSKVQQAMIEHFSSHEPYQTELRMRTRQGNYKWVIDSGISLFNEHGKATLIVGSIIDIDERKKTEQHIRFQNEMLAKANEELDRFVYSASHDMRAPLSSLLGLMNIAEKTDRPEEIAECFERMRNRVVTMEGFIQEITDYSRNSRLAINLKEILLLDPVNDVIENLKFSASAARLQINVDIPASMKVITDVNRLKVILNNLIANAIKYHDPAKDQPFIYVSANRTEHHFTITVEDNGQGIAEEHVDKIFNMFYRASENSQGSGLGLYIVKETLTKLSGQITVDSEKGKGSRFTIELPILPLDPRT